MPQCVPFALMLVMALLSRGSAFAQPSMVAKESIYNPGRYITEKRIKEVYEAFQNLVRPEKSPLSMVDAREIVTAGTFSAMAQSCGLPWEERIFLPMMARYRHGRKLNERYMKLVGFMHGFQQGTVLKALPADACTPDIREFLKENLEI